MPSMPWHPRFAKTDLTATHNFAWDGNRLALEQRGGNEKNYPPLPPRLFRTLGTALRWHAASFAH